MTRIQRVAVATALMSGLAFGAETQSDLEAVIERSHRALGEFVKGKPQSMLNLLSQREDLTLGNPFGPFARGPKQVVDTATRAATNYQAGDATGFDRISTYTTPELACIVEIEHYRAKLVGRDDFAPVTLRVTSVFRREDGAWKIVHRHADPITTAQGATSVVK